MKLFALFFEPRNAISLMRLAMLDSYVVSIHWWEDARILSNNSFSSHLSLPHSGYELG